MLRRLRALMLCGLTLIPGLVRAAPPPPVVKLVADTMVLDGKLSKLEAYAREEGVVLQVVDVESAAGSPSSWLAGGNLVLIDTPVPSARARVAERLGDALPRAGLPWVQIGGGPPRFDGLDPAHGARLLAYYVNGGEQNFRAMFRYLRAWATGADVNGIAAPRVLPAGGFYHPQAPDVFASLDDYLKWGGSRWAPQAPRIAVAIHASALANMQTQVVDALIAKAEAQGLLPLVFWFDPAMPDALSRVVKTGRAHVLVNMQHMGNGRLRVPEFLDLDVPVLQTLNYREGDVAAWRAADSGIAPRLVAPFLAVFENWGMTDPMVIAALQNGEMTPIPEQVDAVIGKAASLVRLQRKPSADKRLALMIWNYPKGEKNLSASHLNVPRSLAVLTRALADAGYAVKPASEQAIIDAGQAMMTALYRHDTLDALTRDGLTQGYPLARYRQWLDGLPAPRKKAMTDKWGDVEKHWAVRSVDGVKHLMVPRLALGNLIVMPQPPRGDRPGAAYHDAAVPPDHLYMAAYLMLRQTHAADALIHFGTHGSQEWLPGKDRGLATDDYPMLALADIPVFYPYIQDNVGEALQARRRGRATMISHQTPAFAPSGLYAELQTLHALIHEYLQLDDGAARQATQTRLIDAVMAARMEQDLGWDGARLKADFAGFFPLLHDHLHELAQRSMPLGLHTFGQPASRAHRLATVLQQLGDPLQRAADPDGPEPLEGDFQALEKTPAYRLLHRHLRDGVPVSAIGDATTRQLVEQAVIRDRHLADTQEIEALLRGLEGRFVPPGPGGDPVRNPEVPSGRNLYGFEPDKLPTRAAYEAGGDALAALVDAYRADHAGQYPEKLAFSLWSSEAMRHLGVLESQVLHALGLRPEWDAGGRVTALTIIPAGELSRPRIDAVVQVTGVYRDQFDGFMRLLAQAIEQLSELEEPGNVVRRNSLATVGRLMEQGHSRQQASSWASVRLFGNQAGDYGTGIPDATLDSTAWEKDSTLAEQYLARMQTAYGARPELWGAQASMTNLYAEQLRGVQAAVLARSSSLHGVLSTDHPFEFLGGLSMAVRHLDGTSPDLFIADLRDAKPRIATAGRFLADEMRSRYLNPHWIGEMQKEGYAGTLQMLNTVNNLWGWQVTDPASVRADQWQAMHDTYMKDNRDLGMNAWFEQHNPTAQAQMIERMAEAIRKGYWDASVQTRQELAERWQALATEHGVDTGAPVTREFIAQMAAGFGLAAAGPAGVAASEAAATDTPDAASDHTGLESVQGQVMQAVDPRDSQAPPVWRLLLALAVLLLFLLIGGAAQWHNNRRLGAGCASPRIF